MQHRPTISPGDAAFARALDSALTARRMSQKDLAAHLRDAGTPVANATLSYWRSGRSLPTREGSLAAIAVMEEVLKLPVGHLSGALPSDAFSRWDPVRAARIEDSAMAMLKVMGLEPMQRYSNVYIHDSVTISADHTSQLETTLRMVRPEIDDYDRFATIVKLQYPERPSPDFEAIGGCSLGRVVRLDDEGLLAIEFVFDRAVSAGDVYAFESSCEWHLPGDEPSGNFMRVLPAPTSLVSFEARFAEPPADVFAYTTPYQFDGMDHGDRPRRPLPAETRIELIEADAKPGFRAVHWDFVSQEATAENTERATA